MDNFLGEIRAFGFGFVPRGWAVCNGQTIPISQNAALYSLLGNYYGGDGRSTFGLPNLQGNVAVGMGQGPGLSSYTLGQMAGAPTVKLQPAQLPSHNHTLNATNAAATQTSPAGNILAQAGTPGSRQQPGNAGQMYSPNAADVKMPMSAQNIGPTGGGGAHNNMQPYVAINFCIALTGIYPTRP